MATESIKHCGSPRRATRRMPIAVGLILLAATATAGGPSGPALALDLDLLDGAVMNQGESVRVRVALSNNSDQSLRIPPLTRPNEQLQLRLYTPENWASGRQGVLYRADPDGGAHDDAETPTSPAAPQRVTLEPGTAQTLIVDLLDLGPPPPRGRWRLEATWSWRAHELRATTTLEVLPAREGD